MRSAVTRAVACVILAASAFTLTAQQPPDPPSAPVPAQIINGRKVFISNASGQNASASQSPDLAYNEFYAAIKAWQHYDLVANPIDADLILEIRYVVALGTLNVTSGNGDTVQDPEIILVIRDPKTQTLLWAFTESLRRASKQNGRQAFDQALAKVVDDLKQLTAKAS